MVQETARFDWGGAENRPKLAITQIISEDDYCEVVIGLHAIHPCFVVTFADKYVINSLFSFERSELERKVCNRKLALGLFLQT